MGEDNYGNDGVEADTSNVGAIPDAITDKFAEVFNNLSPADEKELAGIDGGKLEVETPAPSAEAAQRGKNARKEALKQQQDELTEEGIVSGNDPDGTGEVEAETAVLTPENKEAAPGEEKPVEEASVMDQIDPALKFAANELGWTDEKIEKLWKADPDLAFDTLNQIADTYTNLSRQLLTIPGSPLALATPESKLPAQSTVPTTKLDEFYSKIEAFAENNGTDLADFAKSLKAELIDPVKELLAENKVRAEELSRTEAQTTVGELSKQFPQFYGTVGKVLNEVERNNQAYLAQVADQLRAGARAQGRNVSIGEAIKRAHALITADYRKTLVRKEIKEQVQTRSKQITAKPSQRRDPSQTVGRSREKALEAVSRKMAEIGIEDDGS